MNNAIDTRIHNRRFIRTLCLAISIIYMERSTAFKPLHSRAILRSQPYYAKASKGYSTSHLSPILKFWGFLGEVEQKYQKARAQCNSRLKLVRSDNECPDNLPILMSV